MKHTTGQGPKGKGRTFEKEVVASILVAFPGLSENDVLFRSMGSIGADIILSEAARTILPLAIECKRVGRLENLNLTKALNQAEANCPVGLVPVVVYREDRHEILATLYLLDMQQLLAATGSMYADSRRWENLPGDRNPPITLRWADLLALLGGRGK